MRLACLRGRPRHRRTFLGARNPWRVANPLKASFGVTPKPARETRALPNQHELNILRLRLLSAVRRDRLLHTREALPR